MMFEWRPLPWVSGEYDGDFFVLVHLDDVEAFEEVLGAVLFFGVHLERDEVVRWRADVDELVGFVLVFDGVWVSGSYRGSLLCRSRT